MIAAGGAALILSILCVLMGGVLRDLAFLPWIGLAGLAALDLFTSLSRRKALTCEITPEVFIGEDTDLTLTIAPAPHGLEGRIAWPDGLTGPTEIAFDAGTARLPVRAGKRGVWHLETLWLRWRSRLQLFDFVPKMTLGAEVKVVPNIRLVQSGQITTTVVSTLFGMKENRAIGEGSEFHQLRDFVQGMDVKSIDWKRSARRRQLVAKELRAERNHHVIIALDTGYQMSQDVAGLPKLDHAVTAALATAWAAAIGGDLVGYYAYDVRPRTFMAPVSGRAAFARIRARTAELDNVGRETNHTLALTELNARTPKRSLIIIFTDFVDTTSAELLIENIGILAKRHVLIFVTIRDPEIDALVDTAPEDLDGVATLVTANQAQVERQIVQERLARLGVTVLDTKPSEVSARLISAYLDIKAREVI